MLRMVSYSHRAKSGQITCYLNRTYHVLTTNWERKVDEDWYFNDHVYTNVGYDLISTS